MPSICVAANCSNRRSGTIQLHQFPRDPVQFAKWTKFVSAKRAKWSPSSASVLCSDHFTQDCYQHPLDLRKEFGLLPKTNKLVKNAVPTLHKQMKRKTGPLPAYPARTESFPYRKRKRTQYFEKLEGKRIVKELLGELQESMPPVPIESSSTTAVLSEEPQIRPLVHDTSDFCEVASEESLREKTALEALLSLSQPPIADQTIESQSQIKSTVTVATGSNIADDVPVPVATNSAACQTMKRGGIKTRSVRTQARPHVRSKASATEPVLMVTRGVQCTLLETTSEPGEDDVIPDSSQDQQDDVSDPTWHPTDHAMESEEECDIREDVSVTDERKYIVFERQLLQLFSVCPSCCSESTVQRALKGTLLTVSQKCVSCNFQRNWSSQPFLGNYPAGNILLSASILFSGSLPTKVLTLFRHIGLVSLSLKSFYTHQKEILNPVIEKVWKQQQEDQISSLREQDRPLVLGGDGRADTPGHNAKFGSYTMMNLHNKKVLHVELVQSNEVKNSNAMEKEGFIRSVQHFEDEGLRVGTLITDRHPQIQKLVRETMPETQHYYDVWHVAKGLRKKLNALSKEKDCDSLTPWIRSIVNHLYWCPASSPAGDTELVLDKWRSVINHVQNIHQGHGSRFDTCQHPLEGTDAPRRKWLKSGSKVAEKLGLLLENTRLLRDVKKLSPNHQTSAVESFHRVIITFAPKMIGFSYLGMLSRLYLSALHFNENGSRAQAVDENGDGRYRVKYLKYKKDQHVLEKVTSPVTFEYVNRLLEEVTKQASTNKNQRIIPVARLVPPPLTSQFPKVDKQQAILDHRSRFTVRT